MLAGAFSCRHLNAHRSDEYIVPEASDGDVTDAACPGRILLVEQQVSLPLFLIKTETDTQATFTSHQTCSPKVHVRSLTLGISGRRSAPPLHAVVRLRSMIPVQLRT